MVHHAPACGALIWLDRFLERMVHRTLLCKACGMIRSQPAGCVHSVLALDVKLGPHQCAVCCEAMLLLVCVQERRRGRR